MSSLDTPNCISSPVSAVGPWPSPSRAGQQTDLSGLEVVPASPSAMRGRSWEKQTRDTYGRFSATLSPSGSLQTLLANRLRQRLAGYGSPEYVLTWKDWAMVSGVPICALRASARPTVDKGSTGWPTPRASDSDKGIRTEEGVAKEIARKGSPQDFGAASTLAGWPTPTTTEAPNMGKNRGGGNHQKPDHAADRGGHHGGMAHADGGDASPARQQRGRKQRLDQEDSAVGTVGDTDRSGCGKQCGSKSTPPEQSTTEHGGDLGYWGAFELLACTDGKSRRIEPGSFPLVARLPKGMVPSSNHGLPINPMASAEGRSIRLRGYGNAINPFVAAEFIAAYLDLNL